ncbi:MAG: DUF1643 domain-containing protein [Ramlibacter sp.]|nr:DUF1643 domain-containing protein [Ramlibacter sp.]
MTLQGITRAATFSPCGRYRHTLTRAWDARPPLLACMFNPSDADAERDDPTISLLCHIASHNGYGGLVVVNGIPICSSKPAVAVQMTRWAEAQEWHDRDRLQENLGVITRECERAGAVLLAWGALADRCGEWFEHVIEEIECAVPVGTPIYCLGKTVAGYPKHPLARGKHKVRKDAPLVPWKAGAC